MPACCQDSNLRVCLPTPHAVRNLELGGATVKLVHEPRVAAEPLVALPRPIVYLLVDSFLLRQEGQPALSVLVEIRGGRLHGRQLARALLLSLLLVRLSDAGAAVLGSLGTALLEIFVVSARLMRIAVAVRAVVVVLPP